jgi:hypothetical protein
MYLYSLWLTTSLAVLYLSVLAGAGEPPKDHINSINTAGNQLDLVMPGARFNIIYTK